MLRLAHVVFDQCRPHRLEERHVVADAERIFVRHGQDEGLGEIAHGLQAAGLAVLLGQDVLLRRRQ